MTASTASATGSALALHSDCQWQIVFKFDSDSARPGESESVTVRPSQWHSGSGCSLRVLASGQCSAPN